MNNSVVSVCKCVLSVAWVFFVGGLLLSSCAKDSDLNNLRDRVDDLEKSNSTSIILSMIQSIIVVPTYSDGSVGISNKESVIKFEVLPLSAAEKLSTIGLEAFTIESVHTVLTRSGEGLKLPVSSISYENGLFLVKTSGESLPESFFHSMEGVSCRLKISDGVSNVSSSYFSLTPDNTNSGFAFALRDLKGECHYPFLVENGVIHISMPVGVNLSALYPVINGKDVFMSCFGFEITGKQAFDFSDFTKPFKFKQIALDLDEIKEKEYVVNIYDLPVLMMETPERQPIVSKDERVKNTEMRIVEEGEVTTIGTAGVRGRGNSSWLLDKKPYNIQLDKKYPVLGMGSRKHWVLLANAYYDRTQLHNATAFEMARLTDYPWVQQGRFVELILNGEHRGLYYLCEKVREGENAINIGGGYLLETTLDERRKAGYVYSDYYNSIWNGTWHLGWEIKAPDDVSDEQFNNIVSSLNIMENSIFSEEKEHTGKYRDYYDIETAINWYLVEEAALNEEASRSKNIYMYKDDSGKFKMGPPWDFDAWTFGLYGTGHFYCSDRTLYYNSLLKDKFFVNRLKEKWANYKRIWLDKIPTFIDNQYMTIRRAAERNDIMWPEWCPENKAGSRTYKESVDFMKTSLIEQIYWMDLKIQNDDFSN